MQAEVMGGTSLKQAWCGMATLLLVWAALLSMNSFHIPQDFKSSEINELIFTENVHPQNSLGFIHNEGQLDNCEVIYYKEIESGMIGFAESKVYLWLENSISPITLSFKNSQPSPPVGLMEKDHRTNFYLGDRGSYTDVKSYQQVVFRNLWEGIDLCYEALDNAVKYEFIVSPNADPGIIAIACDGHYRTSLHDHRLSIMCGDSMFVDEGLVALQEEREIDARFVINDLGDIGFKIGEYDNTKELIIDPLIYATKIGSPESDYAYSMALDELGNAYVTGVTMSHSFPTMNSNTTFQDEGDCFVFKVNENGTLLYSAFIGGSNHDAGRSIAIDSHGDVVVVGYTWSDDFPLVDAIDTIYRAEFTSIGTPGEGFICMLNPEGDELLFSTYLGGNRGDSCQDLVLDELGNLYVVGTTQEVFDMYCWVVKLTSYGLPIYSYTIGRSDSNTYGSSIAVDSDGCAIVAGSTDANDFFTTDGVYDRTHNGGVDSFIAKLNQDGNSLIFSTLIGGSKHDYVGSIAIDGEESIFAVGTTSSSDYPMVNSFDSSFNGGTDQWGTDACVIKLSQNGTNLLFSTFLGTSRDDEGYAIALDASGCIHITGSTGSEDEFPVVPELDEDKEFHSHPLCFYTRFNENGSTLNHSTILFGGSGEGLTLGDNEEVLIAGKSNDWQLESTESYGDWETPGDFCFIVKYTPYQEEIPINQGNIVLDFFVLILVGCFGVLLILEISRRMKHG